MNDLYFKKSLDDFCACNLIYKRTMNYMVAKSNDGSEIPTMYDKNEFISVSEYFKGAEKIYKYASRLKPVVFGNIDDISYFIESENEESFILLYASEDLGIGYDLETETYEIIPKKYICDYKTGGWKFGKSILISQPNEEDIIKNLLNDDTKENKSENNQLILIRNCNTKNKGKK